MASASSPLDSWLWYAEGGEQRTIFWVCIALIVQFLLATVVLLSGVDAPYGRYNQAGDKGNKGLLLRAMSACDVPAKVAWVLQECPTLIAAALCWNSAAEHCKASPGNVVVLLCFVCHYVNRTIIYPMRTKGSKPIPLPVMLMALFFCAANGYVQCRSLTRFIVIPLASPSTLVGVAVWALGLYANHHADCILRNLRKPGETGYKIPRGGLFEYVSGANFAGEILEWTGFAIAMGGALPGVMFALCTACNIGPRAIAHHKWYLDKFKDEYPKERKAVIPFIY